MGRVISSNFNSLLDKAEDPRKSVDLTLEEMGEQVRAARNEVVRSVAAEKQLRKKVEELDGEAEKWAKRAELAIKHDDDELAREALMQKKRVTGERDRAEAMRGEQRANAVEMKSELERMEAKVDELKSRRGDLINKARENKEGVEGGATATTGGAFGEFRRMEDQLEGVEAAVSAQREVEDALKGPGGMSRDEVEAKFRRLEFGGQSDDGKTSEVDDELQALKKKVRIGS